MKLFVDAHAFDRGNFEGVTTYLKGIYNELTGLAPYIDFYFGGYDVENLRAVFGQAVNIHYLKYHTRNKYKRLAVEIPRLIRRYQIDAAHYQYTVPPVKHCKEIVTIHDILFKDFPELFPFTYRMKNDFLFRRSARRAELLLTVSEYSRERLQQHYHLDRIGVTPNAATYSSAPDFSEENEIGNQKYILYVGRIEPRKNHLLLVQAYNELEIWRKGIHLILIGRQDVPVAELDAYLKKRLTPDARAYIHFKERVSAGELQAWYKNAELFVYPSLAEGFGIPPLEAAMAGVPCLCSNRTAMKDFTFFEEGLFNPESKQELKEKIQACLSDHDFRKIQSIKSQIREKYNWKASAEKLLNLIHSELS